MIRTNRLDELLTAICSAEHPTGMDTRIVAIDGCGGAGKTTLALLVSERLPGCRVVHTDEFASWDEPLDWWPRLVAELLEPLAGGRPARFQWYDWDTRSLCGWREIEPGGWLVLEGVSSSRDAFRPFLSFTIWIDTPRFERLRRGLDRDGDQALDLWTGWMAAEDDYVAREQPQLRADAVVDGTCPYDD
jgi:uridine kinase